MIKFLFQALLVVVLLIILIPLVMLLFGESALVYKIFDWSLDNKEKKELVLPDNKSSIKDVVINQIEENNSRRLTGKASVVVKNIYVDHNLQQDGKKGMQITVEFVSKNLIGENLYCMVRFYNDDGSPLVQQSNNKKYRSANGNVIVGDLYSPPYDDCTTKATLFIPYDELPSKGNGRTDYILDASILRYTTNTDYDVMDRSKTYSFYLQ